MIDPGDTRFFAALQALVDRDDAACAALAEAVDRAVASSEVPDFMAARQALAALEEAPRDRLLRQLHARMATDLSAIWDALPTAPGPHRPN